MNLIILGAPGSGKGTQAKLLSEKFNLNHISSGDLLREEAVSGSPKGKLIADLLTSGQLLPFETVLDVLEPSLQASENGFILDGTPRDLPQAEALDYLLRKNQISIDKVIYLDIPLEVGVDRILKRSKIEHRSDDNYASVKERMEIYQKQTLPVIDYYQQKNLLLKIDGTPTVPIIFNNIINQLTLA